VVVFRSKAGAAASSRSTNISQSAVHGYLERFTAARLNWPLPAEITEAELEAALFPVDPGKDREPTTYALCFAKTLVLAPPNLEFIHVTMLRSLSVSC